LKNHIQVSNANAQISNADIWGFQDIAAASISDNDVCNSDVLNANV
jgi:hypothetical protein